MAKHEIVMVLHVEIPEGERRTDRATAIEVALVSQGLAEGATTFSMQRADATHCGVCSFDAMLSAAEQVLKDKDRGEEIQEGAEEWARAVVRIADGAFS